jgi:hypothetical protein
MKIKDSLYGALYLGKLSRSRLKYGESRAEPDHSWSVFAKLKQAFVEKHPELKEELDVWLNDEKRKWRSNFNDTLKKQSLALFVVDHFSEEHIRTHL